MPLPTPKTDETKDTFISRCMSDGTANSEFPNEKQRIAVCESQWQRNKMSTFNQNIQKLKEYGKAK